VIHAASGGSGSAMFGGACASAFPYNWVVSLFWRSAVAVKWRQHFC